MNIKKNYHLNNKSIKKYIPNAITIFRIVITLIIIALFIADIYYANLALNPNSTAYIVENHIPNDNILAIGVSKIRISIAVLFVVAASSDFADGYLARKWKVESTFGKIFDPIADKVLVNSTLIYLCVVNNTYIYLVLLFVLRDICVDGLRIFAVYRKIVIKADIFGKLKTVLQMLGIIVILFLGSSNTVLISIAIQSIYYQIINILLYLGCIASLISGILYFKKAKKQGLFNGSKN